MELRLKPQQSLWRTRHMVFGILFIVCTFLLFFAFPLFLSLLPFFFPPLFSSCSLPPILFVALLHSSFPYFSLFSFLYLPPPPSIPYFRFLFSSPYSLLDLPHYSLLFLALLRSSFPYFSSLFSYLHLFLTSLPCFLPPLVLPPPFFSILLFFVLLPLFASLILSLLPSLFFYSLPCSPPPYLFLTSVHCSPPLFSLLPFRFSPHFLSLLVLPLPCSPPLSFSYWWCFKNPDLHFSHIAIFIFQIFFFFAIQSNPTFCFSFQLKVPSASWVETQKMRGEWKFFMKVTGALYAMTPGTKEMPTLSAACWVIRKYRFA